jgi:hypothetical protein
VFHVLDAKCFIFSLSSSERFTRSPSCASIRQAQVELAVPNLSEQLQNGLQSCEHKTTHGRDQPVETSQATFLRLVPLLTRDAFSGESSSKTSCGAEEGFREETREAGKGGPTTSRRRDQHVLRGSLRPHHLVQSLVLGFICGSIGMLLYLHYFLLGDNSFRGLLSRLQMDGIAGMHWLDSMMRPRLRRILHV